MAISNNPLMKGVTGSINKQIVYRNYGLKTVISAYPDMSSVKRSPKQKQQNERMKKANIEVQLIMGDEQKCNAARLRLNVQRNKLHHTLMSEHLKQLRSES